MNTKLPKPDEAFTLEFVADSNVVKLIRPFPPLDPLSAVKWSILKWRFIVSRLLKNLFPRDGAYHTCGLCEFYRRPGATAREGCEACPIGRFTKRPYCEGTPYFDYVSLHSVANARTELAFLRRILSLEKARLKEAKP